MSKESPLPLTLAKKLDQPPSWPSNVPSQEQALEVLRGRQTLAMSLPGARRLQEKLTQPEREALQTSGMADALCQALAMRWRLAAALDLLLTSEGRVDQAALDALMAGVDQALGALRATNVPSPELALAIDRTFETLTQEAVDFGSNVKAASARDVPATAPSPEPKKAVAATGKVTFQTVEPQQPARQSKAAYIALAVAVVAAGAYHARNMLQSGKQESNYPGAPKNTLVIPSSSNGALTVRSTLSGPVTPEQQAWLEQQKARGMRIKEVSPGTWLVTPASKAPVTAGGTLP